MSLNIKYGKLYFLGMFIVFILFFRIACPSDYRMNELKCEWEDEMRDTSFEGLIEFILKKDSKNHNFPTIFLENYTLQIVNEKSGFFPKVRKHDYIKKELGSLDVLVVRNKMRDSVIYTLNYDCKKKNVE